MNRNCNENAKLFLCRLLSVNVVLHVLPVKEKSADLIKKKPARCDVVIVTVNRMLEMIFLETRNTFTKGARIKKSKARSIYSVFPLEF